jgi:mycoredoxin-dependent peroxiredoxin
MPLDVGDTAPDFSLRDQNGQEVRLSRLLTERAVLVVFYPFTFTGICQGELTGIRDHLTDFANERVQVVAISVDTMYSHRVWAEREGYEFPLLADFWPHGAVAQAFGVFNERNGAANRGTFLVGRDGVIRFAEHNGPGEARDQEQWRRALASLAADAAG